MEPRPGTSKDTDPAPDPRKPRPGTSKDTGPPLSPLEETEFISPKKKRQRSALSPNEKMMVVNVYKHVKQSWPEHHKFSKTECSYKTSEITGVSLRSIYNVIKEYKLHEEFLSPKKTGPKLSFKDKFDSFIFAAIRRKMHTFFYRQEAPTLTKITKALNDDPALPSVSRSTTHKILKHIGFNYMKKNRKSCLIDRQDIVLWRQRYLLKIKQYRREGKFIYYQDETWVNEGHTVQKAWTDTNVKTSRQAFLEGLTTGLKQPSGKGKRLIISHIGSIEGFLEGGLLIFEAQKGLEDYHKEMNAACFEKWFQEILPKLKPNSVIVIDNAPYHTRQLDPAPTTSWLKANIQEWLRSKGIPFQESMLRAELLEIVKKNKETYKRYAVDEMAAQHGITLLRLPPYHCELNAIELIWAQVKGYVARNNSTFKMADIKRLFNEGLNEVTAEKWSKCVEHTIKEEDKMMNLNQVMDTVTENFIIQVNDDSDDDDDDVGDFSDDESDIDL